MSDYTLKNFKDDVDDAAVEYGLSPQIESRFARKQLDSRQLGVSYFRFGPGFRAPFGHHHREQEEAYVVISGSGRIKLDDQIVELKQWDVIRIAPEVVRAVEGGPEGMEIIAVGGDRPEGGDGEMQRDWWTD
jgi:mannose-6-phosphate isomerase-like protein (cupin superfamily)